MLGMRIVNKFYQRSNKIQALMPANTLYTKDFLIGYTGYQLKLIGESALFDKLSEITSQRFY